MIAAYRTIHAYVHCGRIGVLVECEAETDFAMRTDVFAELRKDVAMHIAASNPGNIPVLLAQPFVKEPALTVAERIAVASSLLAERVTITRFVRWDQELEWPEPPEPPKTPAVIARSA